MRFSVPDDPVIAVAKVPPKGGCPAASRGQARQLSDEAELVPSDAHRHRGLTRLDLHLVHEIFLALQQLSERTCSWKQGNIFRLNSLESQHEDSRYFLESSDYLHLVSENL